MLPGVRQLKLRRVEMIWPFWEQHMWEAVCSLRATQPFLLILLMTLQRSAYTTWGPRLPSIDSACHLFTTKCQEAVFKTKTRVNSWTLGTAKKACFPSCNSNFPVNQIATDPAHQSYWHLPSTLKLFVFTQVEAYFNLTGNKKENLYVALEIFIFYNDNWNGVGYGQTILNFNTQIRR